MPAKMKTMQDFYNSTVGGGANKILHVWGTATVMYALVVVGTTVEMWQVTP